MAVVVINSATNNVRANCQTVGISVTHGFTLQNGDILYAFVGQGDDPPTVSPVWTGSAGTWTGIYNNQSSTGNDRAFGILRHTVTDAGSEPSSYTFTRNNNAIDNLVAAVVQVRGADTTTPDDTTPVGVISTNDFTPNAPDIDTVTTDALILTAHLAAGLAAQYTGGDARTAGAPAEAVLVDSDVYSNGVNAFSIFLEVAKWENTGSPGTKTIGSWTGTADDSTSEYVVVTIAIRPITASTASDTQALYLKGIDTITDTQSIYLKGRTFEGFFDHFGGSSLDTGKWTAVTSGTGVVDVPSDSYLRLQRPATSDAAYVYYNTKLDKGKSQLWTLTANAVSEGFKRLFVIRNTTAPGTPIGFSNADHVIQAQLVLSGGQNYLHLEYFDSGGTRYRWNPSTNAWSATDPNVAEAIVGLDNYVEIGVEFDAEGGNSRFRLLAWTSAGTGTEIFNQGGPRLMQLTDWVNWSGVQTAQTDLYLTLGHPYNDSATDPNVYFEWVRMEDGLREHSWANGRTDPTNNYHIRHYWSYGMVHVPQDRTTIALNVGTGGSWDDTYVKDPKVVYYNGTYYMFYDGSNGTLVQIGLATTTDPYGTWTKSGSNPIISGGSGNTYYVYFPYVVVDESEPDSTRRCKMVFAGADSGITAQRVFYAYASTLAGTWTVYGSPTPIIDVGSSGQWDEEAVTNPVLVFYNGLVEVWYGGGRDEGFGYNEYRVGRTVGTDLTNLEKDPNNPIVGFQADGKQYLSGTMTTRTGTMTSTTGFRKDGLVSIDNDATSTAWNPSRIRKVNTDTSLEFYYEVDGYGTSAEVRQLDSWRRVIPSQIEKIGSTWYMWTVNWLQYGDNASIDSFWECITLLSHQGTGGPNSGTWTYEDLLSPPLAVDNFTFAHSAENIGITSYAQTPSLTPYDTQSIFLKGLDSTSDTQSIYLAGSIPSVIDIQTNEGRLSFTDTANAYARAIAYATDTSDVELLVKFKFDDLSSGGIFRTFIRGSADWSDWQTPTTAYEVAINNTGNYVVNRISSGSRTQIGSQTQAIGTGYYWLRFQAVGTQIKSKIWADGGGEPAWQQDIDDSVSGFTTPGTLQLGYFRVAGTHVLYIDDVSYHSPSSTHSDNTPIFLKGRDTATDNQPVYLKGADTSADSQPVYLKGLSILLDTQPIYIDAEDTSTDSQPVYLRGEDSSTGTQAVYLKAESTLADTQSIFLTAISVETDTQSIFLKGLSTLVDTQAIFLKASIDVLDTQAIFLTASGIGSSNTQSIYIKAEDTLADSQSIYVKAKIDISDTQSIYILAEAIELGTQSIYIFAQDSLSNTQSIYLTAISTSVGTQSTYLKGQDTLAVTQSIYLKAQDTLIDSQSIYLRAEDTLTDSQNIYLKGIDTLADTQSIYLLGGLVISDTQGIFLTAGGNPSSDTQAIYLKGISTLTNTQSVYLKGFLSIADTQGIYFRGEISLTDNQSIYLKAESILLSNQPIYLKGLDTLTGNQSIFLTGIIPVVDDTQSIYLKGVDTSTDTQSIYLKGSDNVVDTQSIFLTSSGNPVAGTQSIYLKAEGSATDTQSTYLRGAYWPFFDTYTDIDSSPWDADKWEVVESTGGNVDIQSNRGRISSNSSSSTATALSWVPHKKDYYVEADVEVVSGSVFYSLLLTLKHTGGWQLNEYPVNGVAISLGFSTGFGNLLQIYEYKNSTLYANTSIAVDSRTGHIQAWTYNDKVYVRYTTATNTYGLELTLQQLENDVGGTGLSIVSFSGTTAYVDNYYLYYPTDLYTQAIYLKGLSTLTGTQSVYILASLDVVGSQAIYVASIGPLISTQSVYLKGSDESVDSQSIYLKGATSTSDTLSMYLKGLGLLSDNIELYLKGSSTLSDTQSIYLKAGIASTQSIYLRAISQYPVLIHDIELLGRRDLYVSLDGIRILSIELLGRKYNIDFIGITSKQN